MRDIKYGRYKLKALILIALCVMCFNTYTAKAKSNDYAYTSISSKDGTVNVYADDISAVVEFGFGGKGKYNKNMRVKAVIQNDGKDFAGKLRIEYGRNDTIGFIMVQKSFAIAAGGTEKVMFTIPYVDSDVTRIIVCDDKDNIIKTTEFKYNISMYAQLHVGVLSDRYSDLNYLKDVFGNNGQPAYDNTGNRVSNSAFFEITSEDIVDADFGLESIDVIIINDFDTGKLSKEQINGLKEWVRSGGMLLLGSGANADKVLKSFSGNILNGTIGETKTVRTDFGITEDELVRLSGKNISPKRMSIDITKLNIRNSKSVLKDRREVLLSSTDIGNGNVLVAEFSLALSSEIASLYGKAFSELIKENLSEYKSAELENFYNNSYQGGYYNSSTDVLRMNDTDILPNLKLYAVLLIIYVIIAGPILYIILKKKDLRNWLWLAVPVTSVAFSLVIYIIGTTTRIQKPYINYASEIQLLDNERSGHKINTQFTITSSNNKPYEIDVEGSRNIVPEGASQYYGGSGSYGNDITFDYGIDYGTDYTKFIMNNLAAFESTSFVARNTAVSEGNVSVEVSKTDKKIAGTIKNDMAYKLEDCVLYHDGELYSIGDIDAGRAFDIGKINKGDVYNCSNTYDFETYAGNALGGDIYNSDTDVSIKRKISMLSRFYYNDLNNSSSWFYGFVPEGDEDGFTNMFSYEEYGVTGIYKRINVPEMADGYTVIGSLENYVYDFDDTVCTNGYIVHLEHLGETIEVTYKFPEGFDLKEIIYSKETADGEFKIGSDGYAEMAFIGTAYAEDNKTGRREVILNSGQKKTVKNLEKYFNKDGTLTLYYDISSTGLYSIDTYTMPKVKLAGSYSKGSR